MHSATQRLEAAGFSLIRERDSWASTLRPGGKYFLTRNGSTVVAFAVGRRWRPGNPVAVVGAHTDSPCLRVKPVSARTNNGYLQVGVETYGGGIWHSWFDRDLSLAGRVLVRDGESFVQRLVRVDRPLLRIPTLAIHFTRQSNFDPNKETELYPIAGLAARELNKPGRKGRDDAAGKQSKGKPDDADNEEDGDEEEEDFKPLQDMGERHHPRVLDVVASELGVSVADVVDFELVLYDTQKSCIGGLDDEFIFSPRLDNLNMTYCSVEGLIASVKDADALDDDDTIRMVACFDHEEIGSQSAQGAHSDILPAVLRRLSTMRGAVDDKSSSSSSGDDDTAATATAYEQTLSRSFLVSADMSHAVNPNYAGRHEASHQPALNGGVVVKINASQRYATNAPGIVLLQECARAAGVALQLFVVRNDSLCGSTIGPGLAARLGMRTLDLGNPQLSMHSIRETGGVDDVGSATRLFAEFFSSYGRLEPRIVVD